MSSANFIILQALTRIGKNSPLKAAKADDLIVGLSSLQSFMEQLGTMRIILPTNPVRGFSDDLGETTDIRNAIINNLAIEIFQLHTVAINDPEKSNSGCSHIICRN